MHKLNIMKVNLNVVMILLKSWKIRVITKRLIYQTLLKRCKLKSITVLQRKKQIKWNLIIKH